ncbi:MAG: GNAT family N-acetyltransferase [Gemmatimonadaceae bacterium]
MKSSNESAAPAVTFSVERPDTPDAAWCVAQYFAELDARFEAGFDVAQSIPADADAMTPPNGAFIVARIGTRPVASGGFKLQPAGRAYLKRMWVARDARGIGLGRRMLRELEQCARTMHAEVAQLETNRALVEAIAMYRANGYVEVVPFNDEPYAHHWFEKRLE